jgi:hypothetical protein
LPVVKVHDFSVYMKKIITVGCFCISFVALFFILGTQIACQKQSTNCPCTVTVDSGAGNIPVSGVIVRLYAPHSTAGSLGQTNGAGVIDFNFSLPAVYSISAVYRKGSVYDSGSGIIQLEVGQPESATVTIKPVP